MYRKVSLIVAFAHLFISFGHETINKNEDTFKVETGSTIQLPCRSNDINHVFMFWYRSSNGDVIGPKNDFDGHKFKYEVLSGNLTIKAITSNDVGNYHCVSDGLVTQDISVHSVNIQIKDEWDEIKNKNTLSSTSNNNNGNLWKTSAILGSIFVFLIIVLVGLHIYHKESDKPKYFDIIQQNDDENDEDSTEELFTREPSTSGVKIGADRNETNDNFEKVYTAININNT